MKTAEEKTYYTAGEAQSILSITYSALRNLVNTGRIRSITPPGKRQAVYMREDIDKLQHRDKEEEYYTAKEAEEVLGMTYSALKNQVIAGHIKSFVPKGKRQASYLKEDVDKLAREMKAFFAVKSSTTSKFSKATKEDMPEIVALSTAVFGGNDIIPVERRLEWMNKNPDMFYTLRVEDHMMGFAYFLPLNADKIRKIVNEEETPYITPSDIQTFQSGKTVQIYIMVVAVRPGISLSEKRLYGFRLISGLMDVFIDLGKKGIIIESLVSRSSKPDGIRALKHMGFTEIPSPIPGRRLFVINVAESGIPFIQEYKKALAKSGYSLPHQYISTQPI